MLQKLLFLFVVVPLVELMLLLLLADWTSAQFTFLLVIVTGVVGTLLARSQGWKTFRRIQLELNNGKLPTDALLDAAMIFCAGTLLLTPGVLTDILGMTLLIPICRRWYRRRLLTWIRRHFKIQTFHSAAADDRSRIIDSYVVDSPPVNDSPRGDTGDSSNGD
ncbi:MAG: FxsA family protein [Pirellulaceae bacterium]